MKIFNRIQELWDYCLFCPLCKANSREVEVKVGPSAVFDLTFCTKQDISLQMWCNYRNKRNIYSIEYDVNCSDNSFKMDITGVVPADNATMDIKGIRPYFYFWIQGSCPACGCASTHGADLELDLLDKKISNIKLERESVYLANTYHVSLFHDSDTMLVSRSSSDSEDDSKTIKLPLIRLDLSEPDKVINRIKTLILFS